MNGAIHNMPLALLVIVSAVLSGCEPSGKSSSTGVPDSMSAVMNRPECPLTEADTAPIIDTVHVIDVAPNTTRIPEFHDCQRFILHKSWFGSPWFRNWKYDALYAVFASESLNVFWHDSIQFVGPGGKPCNRLRAADCTGLGFGTVTIVPDSSSLHPFVEVVSYDGTYGPLGIGSGFNCLLLINPSQPRAFMVQRGLEDPKCSTLQYTAVNLPAGDSVKELIVHRATVPAVSPGDYPPVARWDWDSVSMKHFIGVRCGAAWCEVSDSGEFHSSPAYSATQGATSLERRVIAVKGWYDEQRLNQGWPSTLRGTTFPDPGLDTTKLAQFHHNWVVVAHTALPSESPVYQSMFNFRAAAVGTPVQLTQLNTIELCEGSSDPTECNVPNVPLRPVCTATAGGQWWARISHPNDATRVFKCVYRRDHPGYTGKIPGAVRWRWQAMASVDETTWISCTQGCCEVRP